MPPIIGITPDYEKVDTPPHRKHERYWVKTDLPTAVTNAGGIPFILSFFTDYKDVLKTTNKLDGLIITGGDFDVDPKLYRSKKNSKTGRILKDRTNSELLLLKAAVRNHLPTLGICGGEQLMAVYFGGSLYQDILTETDSRFNHEQKTHYKKPCHKITITKDSNLARVMGTTSIKVNSTHHQAVKDCGTGLRVSAVSPDGIIEAIEKPGQDFMLGVQWHPEFLTGTKEHAQIFKALIRAST